MGAVGNLVGEITGANKAADAAREGAQLSSAAQTEMFDKNLAFQREQWDYQKGLQQPWMNAGLRGLEGYMGLLNDPSSVRQDPGYQFGFNEGIRGVESSGLAGGMGLSGNTLKGLTQYGQDYASTKYGEALNRQMGLANFGSAASQNLMQGSQQMGSNVGNLMQGQGQQLGNMYSSMGQIDAQQATSGFNTMMGVGSLVASAYGAGMFGGAGAAGGAGAVGGAGSMNIGFNPSSRGFL